MASLGSLSLPKPSRRSFLAGSAAAGAALVTGCSDSGPIVATAPATSFTDVDILNFGLNLEYLEAEFFLRAATGSGLQAADAGPNPGTVTGTSNKNPGLTGVLLQYCAEIAQQELNHLRYIQKAITAAGGTPASRPNLDFGAFQVAAQNAGITGTFNPFADASSFLLGGFIFGDVGVSAYTGSAPLIKDASILSAAAGIQAVEGYHSALIRTLLATSGDTTVIGKANMIQTLRASLGGGSTTEVPLSSGISGTTVSASTIAQAAPGTGLNPPRTFDQTLHIVYSSPGGAGVKGGGFFPNGLNGTISTTQA